MFLLNSGSPKITSKAMKHFLNPILFNYKNKREVREGILKSESMARSFIPAFFSKSGLDIASINPPKIKYTINNDMVLGSVGVAGLDINMNVKRAAPQGFSELDGSPLFLIVTLVHELTHFYDMVLSEVGKFYRETVLVAAFPGGPNGLTEWEHSKLMELRNLIELLFEGRARQAQIEFINSRVEAPANQAYLGCLVISEAHQKAQFFIHQTYENLGLGPWALTIDTLPLNMHEIENPTIYVERMKSGIKN